MMSDEGAGLAEHRRDARTAVLVHAIGIAALIVLWVLERRLGVLGPVQQWLVKHVLGQ